MPGTDKLPEADAIGTDNLPGVVTANSCSFGCLPGMGMAPSCYLGVVKASGAELKAKVLDAFGGLCRLDVVGAMVPNGLVVKVSVICVPGCVLLVYVLANGDVMILENVNVDGPDMKEVSVYDGGDNDTMLENVNDDEMMMKMKVNVICVPDYVVLIMVMMVSYHAFVVVVVGFVVVVSYHAFVAVVVGFVVVVGVHPPFLFLFLPWELVLGAHDGVVAEFPILWGVV